MWMYRLNKIAEPKPREGLRVLEKMVNRHKNAIRKAKNFQCSTAM